MTTGLLATTLLNSLTAGCPVPVTPAALTTQVANPDSPPDPVAALRKQFAPNRGVEIRERHRTGSAKGTRRGVVQFSAAGVTGYSTTNKTEAGLVTVLAVGRYTYQSGGPIKNALPEGKDWLRVDSDRKTRTPFFTPVYPLEPDTLKALLTTAAPIDGRIPKRGDGRVYKGVITYGELYRTSPSFKDRLGRQPTLETAATMITWKLWTDQDGLPRRLATGWTEADAMGRADKSSDLRLTSWGIPVTLTPPPSAKTTT
ncbi:hypothetical protein ACIBG8_24325 [Nonomuraea sp. NPDC050556]|uniref:hypothetical protein n=1 Tax=Nonomuraea sp. NPDC050556 TaxID=3364369 RepID=UPI0037AB9F54